MNQNSRWNKMSNKVKKIMIKMIIINKKND